MAASFGVADELPAPKSSAVLRDPTGQGTRAVLKLAPSANAGSTQPPSQTATSSPTTSSVGGLKLNAPATETVQMPAEFGENDVRSTLEMRVAKRPWLLDKIAGKEDESSKTTPPRPPKDLPDPPSLSSFGPLKQPASQTNLPSQAKPSATSQTQSTPTPTSDGWVPVQRSKSLTTTTEPIPLTDPVPPSAKPLVPSTLKPLPAPKLPLAPSTTASPSVPASTPQAIAKPESSVKPESLSHAKSQPTKNSQPLANAPTAIKPDELGNSVIESEPKVTAKTNSALSLNEFSLDPPSLSAPPTSANAPKVSASSESRSSLSAESISKSKDTSSEGLGLDDKLTKKLIPIQSTKVTAKPNAAPAPYDGPTSRRLATQESAEELLGLNSSPSSDRNSRALPRSQQTQLEPMPEIESYKPLSEARVARVEPSKEGRTSRPLESVEPTPPRAYDSPMTATPPVNLDYTGHPIGPTTLSRNSVQIRSVLQSVLSYYYTKPEDVTNRSNWGMLHAMMVYGADTRVLAGPRSYSTIAWMAGNNPCRGQRIFELDQRGISPRSGAGLQGHQGQMMAIFALCGVPKNYPLYVDGQQFSMEDVIRREMEDCKSGAELTFTLIGLSHYLSTDSQWKNIDGETWNFERLIQEELSQPIVGAACGGTHRLMGFGHALRNRRIEGKPITGQWARAEKFTYDFIAYAYQLQNRDGSMSSNWFEGRGDEHDIERKIQTTGHIVEWLLTVTPDDQLQNPKLTASVNFLLNAMHRNRNKDWSIGPKGHTLRALAMYYERLYRSGSAWQGTQTATAPQTSAQSRPATQKRTAAQPRTYR
jgi:hypothetical protein